MFKFISRYWQRRRERFYLKNRWHLILDFSLGLVIIILAAAVVGLHYYRPTVDVSQKNNTPAKSEYDVNNPPLNIDLGVATTSFSLADYALLKVSLKNNSRLDASDVSINLQMTNRNFSIGAINPVDEQSSGSQAVIDNREINLPVLKGGEEKNLFFEIKFVDKTQASRIIKWQAQTQYVFSGQTIKEVIALPDLKLAAEMDARAVAYYNSPQGDQLGSGPLPPLVGLPTNYWIFFELKSLGNFKDLVFSGRLPKGVELTDRRSVLAGDFKYNSAARQVIWTVPELINQSDSYRVGFEVQLTPTASQLGEIPPLITNIRFSARDTLTASDNSGSVGSLDTNLFFDKINKGQGEVAQP